MSQFVPPGGRLRPLPVVNHWGILTRIMRDETPRSNRDVAHKKMRQTWFQTFIGFVLLGLLLGGVGYLLGGVSVMGTIGVIWLSITLVAWFFSAWITPRAVSAYKAQPGTAYGDVAIRCADRAWGLMTDHIRQHYGDQVVRLMVRPPVMLSPNKHANAFCTGRSWRDSVIVIFEGLIDAKMTDDEIVAVLVHELGHYFHGDVFIQTLASVLGSLITLTITGAVQRFISPFFGRLPWLLRLPSLAVLWIVFRLSGSMVKVVQMFISRSREASADAFAAEVTDDPCALARALKRLVAYEKKIAVEEEAKEAELRRNDPTRFHELRLVRFCEFAVLDALGLLLFVDTLECLQHKKALAPATTTAGKLGELWQLLMENHPPVEERCEWLELAAGQACPCPGVDA